MQENEIQDFGLNLIQTRAKEVYKKFGQIFQINDPKKRRFLYKYIGLKDSMGKRWKSCL